MLKTSQLLGFNAAKPTQAGVFWPGATTYSLTLVDPGEMDDGVRFSTWEPLGSCSPGTFAGKTIYEIDDYPANVASASFILAEPVVSDFVNSVTINGATLYTASATFDNNSGAGPSTWTWDDVNWVGAAAGTYTMTIG